MADIDSKIIGRRVAEARNRVEMTQLELAGAAGIDRTGIAKIENGSRRVSALELSRIAEATGERFEWFVSDPSPAIASYRLGGAEVVTSSIDRALERAVGDVELLQELGYLAVPEREPFAVPAALVEATELASRARELFSAPPGGPLLDLIGAAADIGLFAFSIGLGADAPDAATSALAVGAVSIINSDRAVGRRRLSLAHELGHYLVADAYTVDWRVGAWTESDRVEWLLDVFARALLLPEQSVRSRWTDLTATHSLRDAAVMIASEYRVDMATLAARLSELGLADSDSLAAIRNTTTTRADIIEHNLVIPYDLEGVTLPRAFELAVLSLYRSERISAARTVELLRGTIDEGGIPVLPPVNEAEIWKFIS